MHLDANSNKTRIFPLHVIELNTVARMHPLRALNSHGFHSLLTLNE